jgi:radical SAM protein with 4Fe4S-binding SPASM domain
MGMVQSSGFLPTAAGNVRTSNLVDIYRNAKIFQELQDTSILKGKCGICPFNQACGGYSARDYAITDNYMESDLSCIFINQMRYGNPWKRRSGDKSRTHRNIPM